MRWQFSELLRPRLVEARKSRDLSRDAVARAIGAGYAAFGSWERGQRNPSEEHARRWAALLDVPWPADTEGWFRHVLAGPKPCGTRAAFQRHVYNRQTPCGPCRSADNAYHKDWAATNNRKTRAAAAGRSAIHGFG